MKRKSAPQQHLQENGGSVLRINFVVKIANFLYLQNVL
jgi:hypothetical protein